ncbi:MAG: hypothetical protein ACI9C9_002704, partial [Marivirga sp.]
REHSIYYLNLYSLLFFEAVAKGEIDY